MLATQPEGLPPGALGDLLLRAGRVSCRTDALRARVVAEAERTHAAEKQGFGSTTEWLAALTGEPVPVARSQVAVAEALQQMPETRKAFAAGEVSESRVKMLAQAHALAPGRFAEDEAALVAEVGAAPSKQVPQVLAAWKRSTDPQAAEREVECLHRMRALHISADWSDMVRLNGLLDPESGGVVQAALRALSEPAALDPADTRTPAQRRADALVEICHRHLNGDSGSGSSRPHVSITIGWDMLKQGSGVLDTETGPISVEAARRLACDATLSPIITGPDGAPVAAGEARRIVSPALRRALDLRDQHCTHPGCDMPARWCDAHHIVHWADGGRTVLANLRLLCRQHHRHAHHHQPYPQRK